MSENRDSKAWGAKGRQTLCPDNLHLWRFKLGHTLAVQAGPERVLSAEERTRADRLRFSIDRERYLAGRIWLRTLLASYLGCEPIEIRFKYNTWGKPAVANLGARDLEFNLAHSGDLALCAVARGGPVGIDVEQVRPGVALGQVAQEQFTVAERAALCRLPTAQRTGAFFQCWTGKEAVAKALGRGLSIPFNRLPVSLMGDDLPVAIDVVLDFSEPTTLWAHRLNVGGEYRAAVATKRRPAHSRSLEHCVGSEPLIVRDWDR